ncbi:UbiA family prenyltransferase [Cutibacterium avidum]|uniref:UbiA family prenyltransferase n=1 Tax=Cutibacterium avidum TaxID=33010 RepID=UPI00192A82D6|nr:UbiA family prenyltransferase [Cutibacterium avidum]QQY15475.1 UbiA family prenyltransferase [Cutibacterium avidum]
MLAFSFGFENAGIPWHLDLLAGYLATFLISAVANVHNSYTDYAEDALNLPGRAQLVSRLGIPAARAFVACGLIAITALVWLIDWRLLIVALVTNPLILSYSAHPIRAKARPFLGLLIFSMVVSVPYLYGALAAKAHGGVFSWQRSLEWMLFLTILFFAKGLVKNVPDYEGDKAAGLRTSATIMPTRRAAAQAAVVATWIAYLAYPVFVLLAGGNRSLLWVCLVIPVTLWHVTRMAKDRDAAYLNSVLKWDMSMSVLFLTLLSIFPALSVGSLLCAAGCLLVLLTADLIGADSRAPEHLPQATTWQEAPDVRA